MKYCTDCGAVLKDRKGRPCSELYDEELYSKTNILKLVPCDGCGAKVADRYVECDGMLLLIDLVLQSRRAYRHVLLNGSYNSLIFKMTLLTVISDGYIEWLDVAGPGEFFEQEYQFYTGCLKVVLALVGFLVAAMTPSGGRGASRLFLGLLVAYSTRFGNLMSLLWSNPANNSFSNREMWILVYLLFFVSSVRVHQVTQNTRSPLTSWVQIAVGHFVFLTVLSMDSILSWGPACEAE